MSTTDSTLAFVCTSNAPASFPVAANSGGRQVATDDQINSLRELIVNLADGIGTRLVFASELDLVEEVISLLPIASARKEAASQHCKNARFYLGRGEFGAASYELRLLLGKTPSISDSSSSS